MSAIEGSLLKATERFEYHAVPSEFTGFETTYAELFNRFNDSPYGQVLGGQALRYSVSFGYDPVHMREDLGPDADPLAHNTLTYFHTRSVINLESSREIDAEEAAVALFAAGIHDMGESMHPELAELAGGVVGDIPFGQKTDADRQMETAVRQVLYGKLYPDIPASLLGRVEGVISHTDHNTPAHDLFELAHCVLTYHTALTAGKKALTIIDGVPLLTALGRPKIELDQLGRLAWTVSDNMVRHLQVFAEKGYTSAERILGSTVLARHLIATRLPAA